MFKNPVMYEFRDRYALLLSDLTEPFDISRIEADRQRRLGIFAESQCGRTHLAQAETRSHSSHPAPPVIVAAASPHQRRRALS